MIARYNEMSEGVRVRANFRVSNQTCGLLLMPLEKSRMEIENAIENFIELVLFNDKEQYVDRSIATNLSKISERDGKYLASYLA